MKTVAWTEHTSWDEVRRAGEHEAVLMMRDGHAVALIVPYDDLSWHARERDPEFLASNAQARAQVGEGRTMTHEEIKREFGL
jgi:hypothetical protein